MKYLVALIIFCLSLVSCKHQAPARRDIESGINLSKGGILGKNNRITSCELAVIDNKAAVVAASCLDLDSSNTLGLNTEYAVYLDAGYDGIRDSYKVENITVHPAYNSSNYANNLAILEFNSGSNLTVQNSIAPVGSDYEWVQTSYVQEFLPSATFKGTQLVYKNTTEIFNQICGLFSDLYNENGKAISCFTEMVSSPLSWYNCSVPYGSLYGYASNNKAYIISLLSFSIVDDRDSCDYEKAYSYFTVLAPYLGFIKKTLNRDIKTDGSFFNVTIDNFDPDYKMVEANAVESDMTPRPETVSGNLFTGEDTPYGPPVESNDSNAGNSGVSGDDGSGLSKKNSIILAACVSVGCVAIIVIISLLLWRRYLRKKRAIDLMKERQYQEAMSAEIGGATVPALFSRDQQLPASAETTTEDAILESRYASGTDRSNDIEVHHADLPPPMYEEAINPPSIADNKDDEKTTKK